MNLRKLFVLNIFFVGILISYRCTTPTKVITVDPATGESYNIPSINRIVELDNLNRVYVVDDKNVITNYRDDDKKLYQYANKRGGNISTIDVSNPLRVVVFCDDFNTIKILDNTLSLVRELNINDKFADITACAGSNDGNLWVYDPILFKLVKINERGDKILETSNVNDFGISSTSITDIRERGNYVVMCDRSKGFYIFDNFGQYITRYDAPNMRSFQFDGKSIYYFTLTGLKVYNIMTKEKSMMTIPPLSDISTQKYVLYSQNAYYDVRKYGIHIVKHQ